MNIRDIRELKSIAGLRLDRAQDQKKIALIFGGISAGASLLVTVVNYCLGLQIAQTGGLSNFGIRSVLSALQTVLPIVQMFALLCLELGYMAAMLRISRGQYTSPQTLRAGMQRFWVLVRATLLQSLVYMGVGLVSFYLSMQIFLVTPLSNDFMETLVPLIGSSTEVDVVALVADEAVQMQLLADMIPMYILMLVLFCAAAIPLAYQYRMVNYVLLDKPGMGALAAMRESRNMMRRNRFALFRVDLSFWWYYGLTLAAMAVCYGDVILAMLGVQLPVSDTVSYFLFYGLYLAAVLASCYFLRNKVEVTYALAYDSIRPQEPENNGGVVLGNIFQM